MRPLCVRILLTLIITIVACPSSGADPADLEGGVFIAHHPATFQYSPGLDWCEEYDGLYSISSCEDQNPRIDLDGNLGERSLWYVIAAWTESKTWCGTEFGFGDFDPEIYAFLEYGGCIPNDLSISTDGWPGPNEGTAVTATDVQWDGNFQAVYYFIGYAYNEGQIPLDVDPDLSFGGFGNCATPSETWAAADYGAMGLFQDGVTMCPGGGLDGGGEDPEEETDLAICCIEEECWISTPDECEARGGRYFPEDTSCDPNPCTEPEPDGGRDEAVCCYNYGMCDVTTEADCETGGGWFYADWLSCENAGDGDCIYWTNDFEGENGGIQAEIDRARDGMAVELADGTYTGDGNYNIFVGRRSYSHVISVRSQSDNPENCTIDVEGVGDAKRGILFVEEATLETHLRGITIKNAVAGDIGYG